MFGSVEVILKTKSHHEIRLTIFLLCVDIRKLICDSPVTVYPRSAQAYSEGTWSYDVKRLVENCVSGQKITIFEPNFFQI